MMRAEGMNATVSSIHVNGWFGEHDKLQRRALDRAAPARPRRSRPRRERWVYVGDSTNDQLMFEHFPLSVGVANLMRFADQLHGLAGLAHARRARPRLRRVRRRAAGGARAGERRRDDALFATAAALALGAAVSLGLARFSYALLLPPMRADLGWSYFTAGAMNTANAAGYLVGALLLPRALARVDARALLLAGGCGTALAAGRARPGAQRCRAVRAARRWPAWPARRPSSAAACSPRGSARRPGAKPALVLGLYYGGTGLGIVASALVVPPLTAGRRRWIALAARRRCAGHGADGPRHTRAGRAARAARRRAARAFARATSPSAWPAT